MRSSRRKRNQYVVDLRQNVEDLKTRKREAHEQNNLLRTLTMLWERLCSEVCQNIFEIRPSRLTLIMMYLRPYYSITLNYFTGGRRIKRGHQPAIQS